MKTEIEKLKAEIHKHKTDSDKFRKSFPIMKKKYEREKDDLNKENQSLSKQLEEAKEGNYYFWILNPVAFSVGICLCFLLLPKAGKRTTTDAMVEQAVKEKDEKEQKIQVLHISYFLFVLPWLPLHVFLLFLDTSKFAVDFG